jgi:hypothetical protein
VQGSSSDEFIRRHNEFARWLLDRLLDHAATEFNPPMLTFDASHAAVEETAAQIAG